MKYIVLFFSLILVGADQWFKQLAIDNLATLPSKTIPLIEDFLHLTYVENTGAAFGFFQNMRIILIIVTIVFILAAIVLVLFNKVKSKFLMWTLSLIIAGGLGNLIDRIFRGFVIDYVDLRVINFAVFNFADCCVVIGTILFMIYIIFMEGKKGKELSNSQNSKEHYKLSLTLEDHTNDKSNKGDKVNKYINVVGEVESKETTQQEVSNID